MSNLAEETHLVGRLYETLDGELDRRGEMLAALDDCPDVTAYNQRRLQDPSLPPIPALWVITDEYNEVFSDPIWGPKFRRLYLRIARVGRSLHVFLKLVGQTMDTQNLRDIHKLLGYTIAGRTRVEEESRAVLGVGLAAHISPRGEEGTAYLRVANTQPRKFRFFYTSADFVPGVDDSGAAATPMRAGAEFAPRLFGAGESVDIDGRLTAQPELQEADDIALPQSTEKPFKTVIALTEALQAAKERPPRPIWLPVLKDPTPADELVARWRGRPWYVDYGNNPDLSLPVALADYPRGARQEVHCVDLLSNNALVMAAPQKGATNAVMTMITTGALLYRPERLQFYCIAASGPQLARLADLPHVAAVVAGTDQEGVNAVISAVEAIHTERDRVFTTQRLDIGKVRVAKFGAQGPPVSAAEAEAARALPGGEVVLVIDGWKTFTANYQTLVDRVASLMRARNYGVRVVYTHTSSISGVPTPVKSETGQTVELKLVQEHDTSIKRDPRDPERNPVREVPNVAGRGLTPDGHHMMVGVPVLADPPQQPGDAETADRPVEGDELSAVVRRVAGVAKASTVARLPEKVTLDEVYAGITEPLLSGVVPFGLAESPVVDSPLVTACIDFVDHPHVVATATVDSGMSSWLRAMMRGIMRTYTSEEATIIQIDPRKRLVGVVPEENWLAAYAQNPEHIRAVIKDLCAILKDRQPPSTASQTELATKRFWEGRELFLVVDQITSWSNTANPMAELAPYIEQGESLGLHIVATADIRQFGYQSQGGVVLSRMMNMQPPVLIMNGHRSHGAIVPGVHAQPQRQGKGLLVTRRGTEGVLVGWSEPPVVARRR